MFFSRHQNPTHGKAFGCHRYLDCREKKKSVKYEKNWEWVEENRRSKKVWNQVLLALSLLSQGTALNCLIGWFYLGDQKQFCVDKGRGSQEQLFQDEVVLVTMSLSDRQKEWA